MGGHRGRPVRLATNIYEDRYGRFVRIGTKDHRFPKGTLVEQLVTWRKAQVRKREEQAAAAPSPFPTFAEDVRAYLATIPKGRHRRNEAGLLEHWIAAFGKDARAAITALRIRQRIAGWGDRFKPGSIRHLLRALSNVFKAVAPQANPVREVKRPRVRYDDPRAVDQAILTAIIDQMPDLGRPTKDQPRGMINLAKLRAEVMRTTGLYPAMLSLVGPDDLDLGRHRYKAPERQKGRGMPSEWVPLIPSAVRAFRALKAAGGLGAFNRRSFGYSWARARTKARATWERAHPGRAWPVPPGFRAYDMRHAFLSLIEEVEGDPCVVAFYGRHASLQTTRRYTQRAMWARAAAAVTRIERGYHAATRTGEKKRANRSKIGHFAPKRRSDRTRKKIA